MWIWFALFAAETDRLAPGVVGLVSTSGSVSAWSERRADSPWVSLHVAVNGDEVLVVDDRGNPDRAVVSPDGTRVAYVSAAGGMAGVWVARVADGARVQLTNRSLAPSKSGPPIGWVPPPRGNELRFAGDALAWDGGTVALPEGWR